jgi:hypothetical protein
MVMSGQQLFAVVLVAKRRMLVKLLLEKFISLVLTENLQSKFDALFQDAGFV